MDTTPAASPEAERLQALASYAILDTPAESSFDQIAQLAARVMGTPMAVVNFVDAERQWFKAVVGLELPESARALDFCQQALGRGPDTLVVPDTLQHPVFATHPLVLGAPHIRFYACAPVVNAQGLALGTVAVMDTQPRAAPDADQVALLQALAAQTMAQLELRRQQHRLQQVAHERDHMQAALLAQTETLRVAGRMARVGGWILRLPSMALDWSDEVHGLGQSVRTLAQALDLFSPEHRYRAQRAVQACMRRGSAFDLHAAVVLPGRPQIWVRAVGQAVRNAQGQVVQVQGAFQDVTEQHAQEEALRLSRERFHLVARATADAVWDWDLLSDAMWWNEGMQHLFGVPPDARPPDSSSWAPRLHPHDSAAVLHSLRTAIEGTDSNWSAEYRFRCEDGSFTWVLDRGFVLRDAQGKAVRMVGGMSDIGAHKQAELQAQHEAQTHAELVRVQQQMSAPHLGLDQVLQVVADAARRSSGADGVMVELLHGDRLMSHASSGPLTRPTGTALPLHDSLLWASLQEGQTALCNDTAAAGWDLGGAYGREALRSVLAVPLRNHGTVVGVLKAMSAHADAFSARDVAHLQILSESVGSMVQLRHMAAQLLASETQYKLLFAAHPQPMWVCEQGESPRILAVNQAMVAMYGYSEAELLQMDMRQLWFDPGAQALGQAPHCERALHRHRHKDGRAVDVEVSARSVAFDTGMAQQVMVTDVTERLRAERELARLGRARHLLSACNETLVRATSEAELLLAVCRISVDIGGYRMGWVGLARDDVHKSIEPVAHAGINLGYVESLQLSWSEDHPRGRGPGGTAVRTGQAVIVRDVQNDPQYAGALDAMRAHGFHGAISLPLCHEGSTFGLLCLYAPEVLQICAQEAGLLQEMANDLAFGIMGLRTRRAQQRLHASVMQVAAAVSATTGTEFFVQLARNMAEALDAQAGCVTRLLPAREDQERRAMSLALVVDGQLQANAEYPLAGAPSMALLTQRQYMVERNLAQQYPHAPVVVQVGAQAYAGQQLVGSQGEVLGMVFVLFREPLQNTDLVASTLQIFAARAAAELERQQADARIRRQASLLDNAKDAILVRDLQHQIRFWNQGAQRMYGWSAAEAQGQSIIALLYDDPLPFERATGVVLAQGEWTGELVQKHRDGHTLHVEGRWTLVRGEDGQPDSILAINTDISERKETEREIQRLAFYDALTGLPNRMLLIERMQHALADTQRNQQGGALLFIDLDNFKTLNDTLGHDKGDLLLQQVAQRLNTCVRHMDTVARLGGDEFVVMLESLHADPRELALQARGVGEKILATLSAPYALAGYQYRSTPSIGVAPFQGEQHSVGDLLKQADLAMYQAKAAGRNTLRFFDPQMQAVVMARAALESDFRAALAQDQFVLHYQPQVDHQGRCVGVEALVRWQHPQRGTVPPAEFIALAEETGLILTLGRWVLHTACALLARWHRDPVLSHLTMAVNVSPRQFRHPSFVDDVVRVLAVTGAPSSKLKLELTESQWVEDMDATIATMMALRAYSVGFSLDDFGTGYSNLSYLKRMPLEQLKIDQSFVRDLFTDPNDAAIVNTIIALSESLGLDVIAEGVETPEQRDMLLSAGCLTYQGYLFSPPLPRDQIEPLLRQPPGQPPGA
ncbi:EAL domain-containing protein [Acidovorax sp. SRB_24]|uniref:EAL domain-containing protein n=1 Tax=Acidovorax sp. SRB_24 TaxID=1962700 RepID=UPI00145CC6B0|nr:EAL domain-containing protein [Acidovorax sp. SRB_24]NMM77008.1 diguanylate cyclase [Acidovorax sp. SRB_24]